MRQSKIVIMKCHVKEKQGKSGGFDNCQRPSELDWPVWTWKLTDDLEKQQDISSMPLKAMCVISMANREPNHWFFSLCDLDI